MGGKSPKTKTEAKPLDTAKTKPSVRGTLIPIVLGPARTGPVFGAVGGRSTYLKVDSTTSGGGKGGKKKKPTYTTYYLEQGWHILCMGRMKSLRLIGSDGYVTEKLVREAYPAGTSITTTAGTFRVYWGNDNQPSDPFMNSQFGFVSTWPNMAYIVWDKRELGTNASWPQMEYEIEVESQLDTIGGKPAYISTSSYSITGISMTHAVPSDEYFTSSDSRVANLKAGYTLTNDTLGYSAVISSIVAISGGWKINVGTYAPFAGTYSFDVSGDARSGVNPAAALYQFMFDVSPFGLGRNKDDFNLADFDTLAVRFAADGPEPFPCKSYLSAGTTYKEGIERILQDIGVGWWEDPITGKERLTAVRKEVGSTHIPKVYEKSDLDISYDYATMSPTNTVFTYDDYNRKFSRSTLRESDDGAIQMSEDPASNKIDLYSVSDFTTAQSVVARRTQELLSTEEIPLRLPSEYIGMSLGGIYDISGLLSNYRIKSKSVDTVNYKVDVVFVKDAYSGYNDFVILQQDNFTGVLRGAFPDVYPRLMESPRIIAPDGGGVLYLRMRAHNQIIGNTLLCSPDNTSYLTQLGPQQACAGGLLESPISIDDPVLIEVGPVITIIGPDISNVGDLSASDMLWRGGAQVAVINNEVFYLRNVSAVSATQYRLEGLIRARAGTTLEQHNTGSVVYITTSEQFVPIYPEYLVKGSPLFVKSLPETSTDALEPDQVTAISTVYKGGGLVPIQAVNINTTADNFAWIAGQPINMRWSYKNAVNQSAAGIIRSGQIGVPAISEADFIVTFGAGSVVKRTVYVTQDNKYTYANATMVADFGLEPSTIRVTVTSVLNGLYSEPVTINLSKV